jgi:diguanylate cyclase (GGDEF)-like protein
MAAMLYLTDERDSDPEDTNPILTAATDWPATDGPALERKDTAPLILDCYLSSMLVLAECVEAACPPVGPLYYDQLARIRRRLAYDRSARTLLETSESLETTLTAYADQARTCYDLRSKDLERILDVLSRIEEAAADKKELLEPLLEEVRKRLMAGRQMSPVDALTGLPNRSELERQVNLRLAGGGQFCALFFDINDFGRFNETLGRESGDQVLKQFAERLLPQIRARDVAARWLADEFIVVMECGIEEARSRSLQMAQWLRGPYTLEFEGDEAKIEIRVSAAVTECFAGDTPRQIWLRLEEDFHAQNNAAAVA